MKTNYYWYVYFFKFTIPSSSTSKTFFTGYSFSFIHVNKKTIPTNLEERLDNWAILLRYHFRHILSIVGIIQNLSKVTFTRATIAINQIIPRNVLNRYSPIWAIWEIRTIKATEIKISIAETRYDNIVNALALPYIIRSFQVWISRSLLISSLIRDNGISSSKSFFSKILVWGRSHFTIISSKISCKTSLVLFIARCRLYISWLSATNFKSSISWL